jgi:hypothetical protein
MGTIKGTIDGTIAFIVPPFRAVLLKMPVCQFLTSHRLTIFAWCIFGVPQKKRGREALSTAVLLHKL